MLRTFSLIAERAKSVRDALSEGAKDIRHAVVAVPTLFCRAVTALGETIFANIKGIVLVLCIGALALVFSMVFQTWRASSALDGYEVSCREVFVACEGMHCYDGDVKNPRKECTLRPK